MRVLPALLLCVSLGLANVAHADPDYADPATFCPASRARMEYELEITIRAYDRVSVRDKKWDDDARAAIKAAVRKWGEFPRMNGDEDDTALMRSEAAMSKGCDDPLLLFVRSRAAAQFQTPINEVADLDKRAVERFRKTSYPPILVTMALLRWANDETRATPGDNAFVRSDAAVADARKHVDEALALLPEVMADPKISSHAVVELLELVSVASGHVEDDRELYTKRAMEIMEASPVPKPIVLTAKANAYYLWAWEARGTGFVNTIQNDAWQKVNDRVAVAREALEESWKLDDKNADTARVMQYVEHIQSTGKNELWFTRAADLDPDDQRLIHGELVGLLPQWYGSQEKMIAYGKQCVAGGNWNCLAPLALAEAYWNVAYFNGKPAGYGPPREYFEKSPEIFDELKPIYEHYFKDRDASNYHKTRYAVIAAYSGKWKEADAMFKELGDRFHRGVIYDDDAMKALAKEAAEKAK